MFVQLICIRITPKTCSIDRNTEFYRNLSSGFGLQTRILEDGQTRYPSYAFTLYSKRNVGFYTQVSCKVFHKVFCFQAESVGSTDWREARRRRRHPARREMFDASVSAGRWVLFLIFVLSVCADWKSRTLPRILVRCWDSTQNRPRLYFCYR